MATERRPQLFRARKVCATAVLPLSHREACGDAACEANMIRGGTISLDANTMGFLKTGAALFLGVCRANLSGPMYKRCPIRSNLGPNYTPSGMNVGNS